MRCSLNTEEVKAGVAKLEEMAENKLLTYNHDKCSLVVVGSKKEIDRTSDKLEKNPVLLYGKAMNVRRQEQYLGEQIKENNAESVKATVNKCKGLAMLAINII